MADKIETTAEGGVSPAEFICIPIKLLGEAHAVMRACGWQLAPASEMEGDGVLQLAAAEVEAAFAALVERAKA